MHLERYPVEAGNTAMVYEFVSHGTKGAIPKLVIFSKTDIEGIYNLGFGDKDAATGKINDEAVTNNGDSRKVLATVAATVYDFTGKHRDTMVFATGSTVVRTRLYRIGITNNLAQIKADFEVWGHTPDNWEPFVKDVAYEAFLVYRKP